MGTAIHVKVALFGIGTTGADGICCLSVMEFGYDYEQLVNGSFSSTLTLVMRPLLGNQYAVIQGWSNTVVAKYLGD